MAEESGRRSSDLGRLLRLMGGHWRAIAVGVVGLIGVDVLQLLVPQVVRRGIDRLVEGKATLGMLWWYGGGICAAAVGMGVCRFVWRYFLLGASHRIERDLRERLFAHLLRLPAGYYDRQKVGDLLSHATNDTHAVRRAVGFAALAAIDGAFMSVTVLGMMLWMSVPLTLVTLAPLPLLALCMLRFGRLMHDRFERVQAAFSGMTERAQEVFSGIRGVKAYGGEEMEQRYFGEEAGRYVEETIRLARVWAFYDPLFGALAAVSMALLLWWGGRGVLAGAVTLGEFVAFSSYLGMFAWPMIAVGVVVNMMQRGAASMGRIERILETRVGHEGGCYVGEVEPCVACRNLTFWYEGASEPALREVTFEVPAGGTLGIVGRTGSGKTTLVELLMRIYEPPRGTVFVGGVDVCEIGVERVRELFAYVPQEPFVFSMSVAENIRFGRPELSREAVEELAWRVGLDEEIAGFPQGYDTVVGERGVTLSGGQKQRVAIARALAMGAPILVLDDAFASVDAETEGLILGRLRAYVLSLIHI
ncbi:MAG: ABC transporter ATP-binding protein/permease, partial [bacterium]|nr:ABC transporter ATP-binding protein/permease [bacterium]